MKRNKSDKMLELVSALEKKEKAGQGKWDWACRARTHEKQVARGVASFV